MPRCFCSCAVRARSTKTSANFPFVTNVFVPFRMYSSPFRSARVMSAAESEPEPGSVSANAPSFSFARAGSQRDFCASVPNLAIGPAATELCTETVIATAADARDSSSITSTYPTASIATPPYSSGMESAKKLLSRSFFRSVAGISSEASIWWAIGAISPSAKERVRARSISCCSVSWKFIEGQESEYS